MRTQLGPARGRTRRQKYTDPTEQQQARARAFGEWQQRAREMKGWSVAELHRRTGYSDTHIRILDAAGNGGIDSNGTYRPPGWDYIRLVAMLTGADYRAGLEAAGILEDLELPEVISGRAQENLTTGDILFLVEGDSDPRDTAAAVETFLVAYRDARARRDDASGTGAG